MPSSRPSQLHVAPDGDGFLVTLEHDGDVRRWCSPTRWPGSEATPLVELADDESVADDAAAEPTASYVVLDVHDVGRSMDVLLERGSDGWLRFSATPATVDDKGHQVGGARRMVWMTQRGIADLPPKQRITTFTEHGPSEVAVTVDTREQEPWTFEDLAAVTTATVLECGDYAVHGADGTVLCAVERKRKSDLQSSVTRGRLLSQMHALSRLPRAAVVVECSYTQALRSKRVMDYRLADMLATVQATYPTVPIVYAGNRAAAETYAFRYLAAAVTLDQRGPA